MKTHDIPHPKRLPLLGNLKDIDPKAPIQSMLKLSKEYGPIMQLIFGGKKVLVLGSQELVNEVCDESRFSKKVHASLVQLRELGGDGLFTAFNDEPNWGKAHRILMPALGPLGLRDMFEPMLDIAEQMLARWERFGPDTVLDAAEQMTRLTLDTIALCGFDYRFNSFYSENMHPFVDAMVGSLKEAGARSRKFRLQNAMRRGAARQFDQDVSLMYDVADELIANRRKYPTDKPDLLNRMLEAADPVSGERLSDENIRYQMVTFLIAGHETTSGLLSLTLFYLLSNPQVMHKARASVDEVLGSDVPTLDHLTELRYIEQVLMETLRLWPTAPAFALSPLQETRLADKYPVTPDDVLLVLLPMLHRDPQVWGDNVEAFQPERFDPEKERALAPNAWKPFGNGARACIGRPFAMQEAVLVLSMLLQRFDVELVDPSYQLKIKETLTLKPEGLDIRVKRRALATTSRAQKSTDSALESVSQRQQEANGIPLLVLFGSNAGSTEAFARRTADAAARRGFDVTCHSLDEQAGALPCEGAVLVFCASYEGQPPDNAVTFVTWLKGREAAELNGVRYAVFGCGSRQWPATYQSVPQLLDQQLSRAGAMRLIGRAEADSSANYFAAFDSWESELWATLDQAFGLETSAVRQTALSVMPDIRYQTLKLEGIRQARVLEVRELSSSRPEAPRPMRSKMHIQLELPAGVDYQTGDYLAVLPSNLPGPVHRVLRRFGVSADLQVGAEGSEVFWRAVGKLTLADLLVHYLELGETVSVPQLQVMREATRCPPERAQLDLLLEPHNYISMVQSKGLSVLDLLEQVPGCELSLADYLAMLPPLRPRQYSISSAPSHLPGQCSLTISVLMEPAWSGIGRHCGVASCWLAGLQPGDVIPVAVRPSQFRLPVSATDLIMVAAGSGIAPFRGFLQQRALQDKPSAPDMLFYGCRHPMSDLLYADELRLLEDEGRVVVHPAYSELEGIYVQDALWTMRSKVIDRLRQGAYFYLCGEGVNMAPAVRSTLIRAYMEAESVDEGVASTWLVGLREQGRYAEDIFS